MRYEIRFHPLVERDLEDISDLIRNYAGLEVTKRKLRLIRSRIEKLGRHPHMGSIRDELHPGLRAVTAARKAVVCFTVDDETRAVLIICITYGGANWQGRIEDRAERDTDS